MLKIFINPYGRLRSGWRLVLYILVLIAISYVLTQALRVIYATVLVKQLPLPRANFAWEIVSRGGFTLAALAAAYLCVRFLEGLPWRSLGLTRHTGWLRDFLIGSAIGFAALIVAVGIAMIGGGLRFSLGDDGWTAITRSLIASVVLFIVGALAEEVLFRGYGLQTLARARLAWLGVLLTCLLFGMAHLSNPNVVPGFTLANTVLAGIWLAVAYLRTRSLWLPLGVHWAWNWALGWFFGISVSGANLVSHPLFESRDAGPFWLSGGSYGIEGGAACTIAITLFTIFLWRTSLVSATPELLRMTSEENPATPRPVVRPTTDYADYTKESV